MSEGHPQPRNGKPQAGFYVAGNDFVHWNRDGHGAAYIGGQWSEIERSQITRVDRGNGVVDLNITRNGATTPLLHIDPREPALRPEHPQIRAELRPALSPQSQQLINDSEHHARALTERHQLPWDQGMDNTVHALAAEARAQGMTGVDHLKVKDGQIRFAQQDGFGIREGQLDARAAANTDAADSRAQLASADQREQPHAQTQPAYQIAQARSTEAPVLSV